MWTQNIYAAFEPALAPPPPLSQPTRPQPMQIMQDLRERIQRKDKFIPIEARLKLTKTSAHPASAILLRDLELEQKGQAWLSSRVPYSKLMERYRAYDPRLSTDVWPTHLPVRVVSGCGAISSGKNIFLFFPEVLGLVCDQSEDTFGFELVDIWRGVFEKNVFPCFSRLFDRDSQMRVFGKLVPVLDETIYIASVLHEIGHRVGPFAVSPKPHGPIRVSEFQWEVSGELSTDALLSSLGHELPELALFVLLQRLFWFGRRGFSDKPMSAWINSDNDSWIAAYVWQKARRSGVILPSESEPGRWSLADDRLAVFFGDITRELDAVGNRSEASFDAWMETWVSKGSEGEFELPIELRYAFEACMEIPEFPHFRPLVRS
jgi:hypothetical protein